MTLAASPPRRLSPRLLPLLAALLALTVLAPAGPGGRPAAQAQSPAPPQVTVNLYSSSLLFRTLPATLVTAELTGPKGRKAEGVGVGDAQGVAQVGFYTGETSILPGDTIVLSRANDKPLHLTVPQLAASLVELPTVEGIAPPGVTAQLSLKVQGSPAAIEKQVVADSQGAFTVDLSAQLSDPDAVATGSLTYDSPEGGRFVLALATVDAQITLGAPALRGRVTAGWEVSATVTAAGGSPVKIGPVTAGGDGSFLMSLQPLGRPIAVGDNVDLRATGGGQHINWFSHHINQVKDITVTLDRSSDLATGTAPRRRSRHPQRRGHGRPAGAVPRHRRRRRRLQRRHGPPRRPGLRLARARRLSQLEQRQRGPSGRAAPGARGRGPAHQPGPGRARPDAHRHPAQRRRRHQGPKPHPGR
ncbi:hypothetical protein [Candidatus Amarobacter glycogenicus]|uniref:hypothetical protein n=1 Tax=Candidatus Amarobacter glycogenicus TaxID=3140699 RepID=UPI003134ED03|nr:hypothetical protein [Dehalococcoidia bacterium]